MTDNSTPEDSAINEIQLPDEHPAIAPLSFLLGHPQHVADRGP